MLIGDVKSVTKKLQIYDTCKFIVESKVKKRAASKKGCGSAINEM